MRDRIVPEPQLARLLTTDDAAKVLGVHRRTVLKLARRGELAFEPTRSGQLIFHAGAVHRCLLQRGDARTRSRSMQLAAIHLRMAKAGIEPQQLNFWRGLGLRIIARGESAGRDRAPKGRRLFEEMMGSEKGSSVNRKVAGQA